jgi:hypothetical protein
MFTKLDNLLQKVANWKTVLVLFVISFPIGYYIDEPLFYKIGQIDYYYSYTVDRVYSLISYFHLVGELKKYVTYQLTFQVFFPFVTALFFITFIYHAGNGLASKKLLVPFALIIPTITLLIDYLENAGLVFIIRSSYEKPGRIMDYLAFASKLRNTVEITSGFATIKGFLWDTLFLIFIAGIAVYIFKMLKFSLNKMGILKKFKKDLSIERDIQV